MSARSRVSMRSTASGQTIAELEDVLQYCLRVAYLAHLQTARATPTPRDPKSIDPSNSKSPPASSRPSLRATETWTNALMSLGDVFKDSKESKNVKFPKEMIKMLQQKIELIAKGTDPVYTDLLLRSTLGVFYGTYTQDTLQRQLKENRQIEELILLFVTTATNMLKKRLPGDEWKEHLNTQVGQFVNIIRQILRTPGLRHVPPELLTRLDTYAAKLAPTPSQRSEGHTPTASQSLSAADAAHATAWNLGFNVQEMPMVMTVGQLFGVQTGQLQKAINGMRRLCTEKAAIDDLKACSANISQNSRFPARREDFSSDDAYQRWRSQELSIIQQMTSFMIKSNKELVMPSSDEFVLVGRDGVDTTLRSRSSSMGASGFSGPNSNSILSITEAPAPDYMEDEALSMLGQPFVYIPPSPRAFYERLLERCLDYDLEAMKSLAEDDEVSLKILSQSHLDLLNECAIRWRIMLPFRASVFLRGICSRFAEEEIPIVDCVSEALTEVAKVQSEWQLDRWTTRDRKCLTTTLSSIFDTLFRRIYEAVQFTLESKAVDDLSAIYEVLLMVAETRGFQDLQDIEARYQELTEAITQLYDQYYQLKSIELFSSDRPNDVVPFILLIEWINSVLKRLNKRFAEPILDRVDPVTVYMSRVSPALIDDVEAMKSVLVASDAKADAQTATVHDEDILDLYKAIVELKRKYDLCFPTAPLELRLNGWFGSYIEQWLDGADAKTSGWVRSAIEADKFEPQGNGSHSSSVTDLMDSCRSAIDFIQKLQWPDEHQNAKYITRLARMISKSIEQYCHTIEDMFMLEMFPRASTDADREANRSAIWTRARMAVQGDKKPEAFQFQDASCVKLNNIEAARLLLDQTYTSLDADSIARIIHEYEPEVAKQVAVNNTYFFTVKVVTAEGLAAADGTVTKIDPFLTLSDERGQRVAKTRTQYETTSPRWNESFDISVRGSLWLAATVWRRKLVDQHDMMGRSFLHLDPRKFNDFLAHDVLLNLDTQGRLLLRVSMEGEKDDIQFYFGRAFRSLKRAETDMIRAIVDKISPVVRHYLSHSSIRKLIPSPGFMRNIDIDMSKVRNIDMSAVKNYGAELWRHVGGGNGDPQIPLPKEEMPVQHEVPAVRTKGNNELTDGDIEEAIGDLFEYFDQCMSVLRHSLSDAAWQLVMTKIWKEILNVVDSLLLPPLSDQPAEMRPLSDKEVDVVFKWLKFLTNFFHANGEGVPIEDLHNAKYKEVWSIRLFYDMGTDALMMECVRAMQQHLQRAPSRSVTRNKSVYQQRNLGTIRKRKAEKKQVQDPASCEMIMRILRMRLGTTDFLTSQLATLQNVYAQQSKQANRPAALARRVPSSSVSNSPSRSLR